MPHFALGEQRMRRLDHRLAVLRGDEPAAGEPAHLQVGAGEHSGDARRCLGCSGVSRAQLRVSMGAAQQKGMKLAWPIDIVSVGALSGKEAKILLATDSRP